MSGPGLWKFNNTLLKDENYIDLIEFYYPQFLNKYSEVVDEQLLWELIKMELRTKTIKYSTQKISSLRNKEEILQNELQELDYKICNNDTTYRYYKLLHINYVAIKRPTLFVYMHPKAFCSVGQLSLIVCSVLKYFLPFAVRIQALQLLFSFV